MNLLRIFLFLVVFVPITSHAQQDKFNKYQHSTSMDVMSNNSYARDCFRAAGIAARIHYTSSNELENCDFALNYGAMSLRDRAATLTNRGIIHMALEDYERAIADYTSALNLRPDFGEIYVNIGNIYFLGKVFDKAIEQYTLAIEKETSKAHIAYINRGMAYESMSEFDNAAADYQQAANILPDAALPQVRLDQVLHKKAEELGIDVDELKQQMTEDMEST